MNIDEVEAAVCACFEEGLEIVETCCAAAVGDCWRAELDFAVEGLEVLFVDCDGICDFEVGLAGIVGLVRAVEHECK